MKNLNSHNCFEFAIHSGDRFIKSWRDCKLVDPTKKGLVGNVVTVKGDTTQYKVISSDSRGFQLRPVE